MNVWQLVKVHRAAALVLALLALSASLLLAALPRGFEKAYDEAVRGMLGDVSAQQTDLAVTARPNAPESLVSQPGDFETRYAELGRSLPPNLRKVVVPLGQGTSHFSAKTNGTPVDIRLDGSTGPSHEYVDFAWLPGAANRVKWVEGTPPGPSSTLARVPGQPELRDLKVIEIGLVAEARDKMNIKVGATLLLGNSYPVVARVTGIYEVTDRADRFWEHNYEVTRAVIRPIPGDTESEWLTTGLVSDEGLASLDERRELGYSWVYGLNRDTVSSADVKAMVAQVDDYKRILTDLSGGRAGSPFDLRFGLETGLDLVLTNFLTVLRTAETLLYLLLGGLAVVSIGVLALAVQLLTERMRTALSLVRARGASLGQVVRTGVGVIALGVAPAALLGYGLSYLVTGPSSLLGHLVPVVLSLTTILFATGRLALAHRRPLKDARSDLVSVRPSPRRIALEFLVVLLGAGGAYLLRTRGVASDAQELGADPLLMLAPAGLALAAGILTLRLYPLPLKLFTKIAGRRPGAVPFLGLTLAARSRGGAALPVLILLPALAVSVFGALVSGAISDTQSRAAWQDVGASARVERSAEIPEDVVARVEALPGVNSVVRAGKGNVQVEVGGLRATVVSIDLKDYRELVADSPLTVPDAPRGLGIPALMSKTLTPYTELEIGWHTRMKLRNMGRLDELPGLSFPNDNLIVMPFDGPKRAGLRTYTNMLLIDGDVDRATLERTVGLSDTEIETYATSLTDVQNAPLAGAITVAFTIATLAMGVYALVAVIVALVIGAADRTKALSFLRTLGLSQQQARTLTVLEVAPLIVLTAVAGLALGLTLPLVLGPGLDLSAFAGLTVTDFPLTFTTPALLAAGLAAVSILGAFAHATAGRRVTTALRVGESS
ncbi:FtsX-like permease family protein [Herbidospora mongoliensis]|uniref:FtsX-like permease family protein n=1 Tax=Herbidospora mongoliensis TaxID=688067 RepID=UPI00082FD1A7|nr:FtsX-like permease family protein [Herbidospora mongoliensis]